MAGILCKLEAETDVLECVTIRSQGKPIQVAILEEQSPRDSTSKGLEKEGAKASRKKERIGQEG